MAAALAVILVTAAWPSFQDGLIKARRSDAIGALTRVQFAQEQYRAVNGTYAGSLSVLRGAGSPLSPEGLYDIALDAVSAEGFTVVARPRAGHLQTHDRDCTYLSLAVQQGIVEQAPSAACWNR